MIGTDEEQTPPARTWTRGEVLLVALGSLALGGLIGAIAGELHERHRIREAVRMGLDPFRAMDPLYFLPRAGSWVPEPGETRFAPRVSR